MLLRIFLKQGVSEAFRHHTKIAASPPENAETPEQHCCCIYYIGVISLNLFVRRCYLPRFVHVPRSPPSGFRSALHPENPTATFSRPPCLPVVVHIAAGGDIAADRQHSYKHRLPWMLSVGFVVRGRAVHAGPIHPSLPRRPNRPALRRTCRLRLNRSGSLSCSRFAPFRMGCGEGGQ